MTWQKFANAFEKRSVVDSWPNVKFRQGTVIRLRWLSLLARMGLISDPTTNVPLCTA
jgi:hypothetical protein